MIYIANVNYWIILKWEKTPKINKSQNPQWDILIELPICNYSDFVEIELNGGGVFNDTKLGYFKDRNRRIIKWTWKKTIKLEQGVVHFLIAKGKQLEKLFDNYQEKDKIIIPEKATLAVKIIGLINKIEAASKSSTYCLLSLGGKDQKTCCINFRDYPKWNQLFYLDVPSYSINALSIKIMNNLNKNDIIKEFNFPINQMECGVVKESSDYFLKFITHLIETGKASFESNPFKVKKIIVKLENCNDNTNNISYCLVKLKGDEYWKYTKQGKFNDFFTFEYIDQDSLIIKSFDGNNNSQENSIDITEFTDNK